MSALDWALLASLLLAGATMLAGAPTRGVAGGVSLAVLLAVLQAALEGWVWQFAPAYLALAATAIVAFACSRPSLTLSTQRNRVLRLTWGVAGLALCVGPWAIAPAVPRLARPEGPHPVGTLTFRWIDPLRPEDATPDARDRRSVIAQAWYPAVRGVIGKHSAYIDGQGRLPATVAGVPGLLMRRYGQVDTHAVKQAPVSDDRPRWPVVLFSPGAGAPRAFYTSLVSGLASRGYVVIALDHPYESAVTQLADGRVVTDAHLFARIAGSEPREDALMAEQQRLRAADIRFVLDQLGRPGVTLGPLGGRLDLRAVAATGHSFGGASAVQAMIDDDRIRAAVNLDGTPYGALDQAVLTRPFLLLESDRAVTRHGARYLRMAEHLISTAQAPASRQELKAANHFSFTDAPAFLSPPARFLATRIIGGGRNIDETHRTAVKLMDGFLTSALRSTPTPDVGSGADRKPVAGRVGGSTLP